MGEEENRRKIIIMELGHNTQKLGLFVALCMVVFFSMRSCENKDRKIHDLKQEAKSDSLNFVTLEDKSVIQEEVIINQKKTFNELTEKVNGLKAANRQLKATVLTEVSALPVAPKTSKPEIIKIHDTIDGKIEGNYMKLPQSYGFEDQWKGIYYSIDSVGNSKVDRMWFVNKPMITFGYEAKKFPSNLFSRKKAIVSYKDENPNSKIQGLQNYTFNPKPRFYERKGFIFGIGVIGGIFVYKQLK